MGFFSNLFSKKETPVTNIHTNADFWNWFKQHEAKFYEITKSGENVHLFHDKLAPKLQQLRDGYYFLSGMLTNDVAELIITADGHIKNFVFVEDLIADAPEIKGWKFTALKPSMDNHEQGIQMDGYEFSGKTISFYANEQKDHPDEIDLTIVNTDLTDSNKDSVILGTHIFLDNFLGEINFATTIDTISVVAKNTTDNELIPIEKLKPYLIWREKEFVEKYEGIRHNTDDDTYTTFEGSLNSGDVVIAIINTSLLEWDCIASHPWIARIEIEYDGSESNGLPNEYDFNRMNEMEDKLLAQLKDAEGYLNIGRETGENIRTLYFACKEYRKPAKVIDAISNEYQQNENITHTIYKDKYWQTFDRFRQ